MQYKLHVFFEFNLLIFVEICLIAAYYIQRNFSNSSRKGIVFMRDLLDIEIKPPEKCTCLKSLPLAYAYVPFQMIGRTYSMQEGFTNGTIFPELNKPLGVYGAEFLKGGAK